MNLIHIVNEKKDVKEVIIKIIIINEVMFRHYHDN